MFRRSLLDYNHILLLRPNMAAPFLREVPTDLGAVLIRRAFKRERVLRDRQDPLAKSDNFLVERYRFSREGIIYLTDLLKPHISNSTRRSNALTATQTLCIALRFFCSGTFLYTVGDAENLGTTAVCRAIRKVYLALKRYLNVFVRFPGHLAEPAIKDDFYAIAAFPNVIGAVDCTQIPIKAPSGPEEGDFVNRKGFHSINVQMICDSTCLISNVEAKWPGAIHDSRIFTESDLCTVFEHGHYDGILIGDRSYSCRSFLLTPYPDPRPGPQARYNAALALTRAPIQRTFGQLKGRFQCLNGLKVAPDRACDITVACVVLHNIATIRRERAPVVLVPPDEDVVDPENVDEPSGSAARDRIAAQYFE
ncbi:putative nuclease HARBI1 [Polymixia lowei]